MPSTATSRPAWEFSEQTANQRHLPYNRLFRCRSLHNHQWLCFLGGSIRIEDIAICVGILGKPSIHRCHSSLPFACGGYLGGTIVIVLATIRSIRIVVIGRPIIVFSVVGIITRYCDCVCGGPVIIITVQVHLAVTKDTYNSTASHPISMCNCTGIVTSNNFGVVIGNANDTAYILVATYSSRIMASNNQCRS